MKEHPIVRGAREAMVSREHPKEKLKTIDDCVKEAPGGLEFAEWLLSYSGIPQREIMQAYMIWKYKWNERIDDGNRACELFVERGFAKRFSELYHTGISAHTMYERLFNGDTKTTRTDT